VPAGPGTGEEECTQALFAAVQGRWMGLTWRSYPFEGFQCGQTDGTHAAAHTTDLPRGPELFVEPPSD